MTIDPLTPPPEFQSRCSELGVEFEGEDLPQLGRFLALMLEANKAFNLTAITDPAQAWIRHILDALTLVPVLAALTPGDGQGAASGEGGGGSGELNVIDVGSGGGVPGLPLAIVMPQVRFTLVDATGKKARFLEETVRALDLHNVVVIQDRAERLGRDKAHREQFDVALARALGSLAVLAALLLPLVRVGGVVLAVKGARAEAELAEGAKAIGLVGGEHDQTIETPTGKIVVLAKAQRTPRDYPRHDGEPGRSPLGVGKRE